MALGRRSLGRVLVTGAGGFLGAALMSALQSRKVETLATDFAGEGALPDGMTALDVRDTAAILRVMETARFDTVFHCGAVSGPMVMADRPLEIWNINAGGTANLLEAARRTRAGRVVVCSTVEVYGSAASGMVTEAALPRPDGVYGASKAAAEQATLAYHSEHGLDTVALRLAWIYGPGRKTPTTLAALLADSLAGRTTTIFGHPSDATHYLYIDDAVDGLLCAAMAALPADARIFNIAAGPGLKLSDVLDQVRAVAPGAQIDFQAHATPSPGPAGFSPDLAAAALGFRARTSFKDGLTRYLAHLRGANPASA